MDLRGQSESGALLETVRREISRARTHTPGTVVSFNSTDQLAVIQPNIRRYVTIDDERITVDMPEVVHVPLVMPYAHGAGFALTLPVRPGDQVLLAVCDRSIDNWVDNSGVQSPAQPVQSRSHHITDSLAIVGANPAPVALANYFSQGLELRNRDRSVRMSITDDDAVIMVGDSVISVDSGIITLSTGSARITINSAGGVTIDAPGGLNINGDVTIQGLVNVSQVLTALELTTIDGLTFSDHVHTGVDRGTQTTDGPS